MTLKWLAILLADLLTVVPAQTHTHTHPPPPLFTMSTLDFGQELVSETMPLQVQMC